MDDQKLRSIVEVRARIFPAIFCNLKGDVSVSAFSFLVFSHGSPSSKSESRRDVVYLTEIFDWNRFSQQRSRLSRFSLSGFAVVEKEERKDTVSCCYCYTTMATRDPPLVSVLIGTTLLSIAATAVATHAWTKRRETMKYQAIANRQYEREKMLKEKTALARRQKSEPPAGSLVEDVIIDKVFLWECVDLRKRFPSAMTHNTMKISQTAARPTLRSPLLRRASSNPNLAEKAEKEKASHTNTEYNKLITDHECILGDIVRKPNMKTHTVAYMRAGPRKLLHFDPKDVNAAIVTCGGLCPGLNNVIRELTKTLVQIYGIGGNVYGIQGGYRGFYDKSQHLQPLILTPSVVENIHHEGGTVLGSSRGGFDLEKILDFLESKKVNQLYVIGGDGTHRGAFIIHEGCMTRGLNVAVAGIPKTIDKYVSLNRGIEVLVRTHTA